MWSPGGQLPYEYIKIKKKIHVCGMYITHEAPPPPTVLLNQVETRAVQGSERLLGLAFLWT